MLRVKLPWSEKLGIPSQPRREVSLTHVASRKRQHCTYGIGLPRTNVYRADSSRPNSRRPVAPP